MAFLAVLKPRRPPTCRGTSPIRPTPALQCWRMRRGAVLTLRDVLERLPLPAVLASPGGGRSGEWQSSGGCAGGRLAEENLAYLIYTSVRRACPRACGIPRTAGVAYPCDRRALQTSPATASAIHSFAFDVPMKAGCTR